LKEDVGREKSARSKSAVFASILVLTLVNGSVYALLAAGLSLLFGVGRIINLAHTAFFVLAGYAMWSFTRALGWGAIPSIVMTVAAITLAGILAYRFIIDRVRQHPQAVLLITVAMAMAIQEILLATFGEYYRTSPGLIAGETVILGSRISNENILIIGVAVVIIIIIWLLLAKTRLGTAIRATADDAEIASTMGISVPRTLMITMGIATALAALAACLVGSLWITYPMAWMEPLTTVLIIVVLGGLGSIKGSFIAAYMIALAELLAFRFISSGAFLAKPFMLLVLVIVLVVRPGGLFGIILEEERL
jgi:branched-chain amino acid transport system permease protein